MNDESKHFINKRYDIDFVLSAQFIQFITGSIIGFLVIVFFNIDIISCFAIFLFIMIVYAILMTVFPPIQNFIYFMIGFALGFIIASAFASQVTSELSLKGDLDLLTNN